MSGSQSQNKTQKTKASVTEFLTSIGNPRRRQDGEILLKLMRTVSGKKPVMWGPSIIGFDEIHYKYASGREGSICRIGFSPRSGALTLYLTRGFDGCEKLLAKLGKHKTSKACLYINKLDDVDMLVLEQLIQRAWDHSFTSDQLC